MPATFNACDGSKPSARIWINNGFVYFPCPSSQKKQSVLFDTVEGVKIDLQKVRYISKNHMNRNTFACPVQV